MRAGGAGSGVRARPGGGFNPGMGQFNEHLDESAFQSSVTQKMLGQQQGKPTGAAMGAAAKASQAAANANSATAGAARAPRPVGSLSDELITRPAHDLVAELSQFFSLNNWLGISPITKDPAEQQKRQVMVRRYQQLLEEDRARFRQSYQMEQKRKEQEKQEEARKKQEEAQQKQRSLQMPSSPKKGPVGPAGGSRKKQASAMLEQDRKSGLNKVQGAG